MFNCIVFCADDMTRHFLKLHPVRCVKSIGARGFATHHARSSWSQTLVADRASVLIEGPFSESVALYPRAHIHSH